MKAVKSNNLPELSVLIIALFSFVLGYLIASSAKNFNKADTFTIDSISSYIKSQSISQIYVATNPRGAERLPPNIIEAQSDFFLRAGCGGNDTLRKPNYLLTLTVGIQQKYIVNKIVSKFSENFTIILFHYDGKTSEWDQFEWSQRAIHITTFKQAKWWYAKRFLHPDIVAAYDYIFIWDEDFGVDHFNAEEYVKLVKKYGLEISQPAVTSDKGLTFDITRKRENVEVHRLADIKECPNLSYPPCSGFIEIMAPVFSRKSWNCVWNIIQNDLVHGWGLDFAFHRCVEKPVENIGVVDAQWIKHLVLPTLGNQGESSNGKQPWVGVKERCRFEWKEFGRRMKKADQEHRS